MPPASPLLPPTSLLLLARFKPTSPGTGGAESGGGLPNPGIAGAPPTGGPVEGLFSFPTTGADRSFVTAFLSLAPFVISVSKAP